MATWKSTLPVHVTWGLAVAAAWWLGGRGDEPTSAITPPVAGRVPEAGAASASPSSRQSGLAPRAALTLDETADWLKKWAGAGGNISPDQMTAAVQAALADPDSGRGLRRFSHLLTCLTPENATAAGQLLRRNPSGDAGPWMMMLASAWGRMDGEGALGAFSDPKADNDPALNAAMKAWAAASPGTAKAWMEQRLSAVDPIAGKEGVNTSPAIPALHASFVRGLAGNDPAAAVAYVTGLSDNRGEMARVLVGEQLRHGAPAAARWAAELPDETMRGAALEAVARRYLQVDADAGAAWGVEIAQDRDTRAAVARVADRMAESDVRAAFEWTLKLPPSPGQDEAFQQVFSEWARQDPGASSEQLQRMSPGPERDNAIHAFSRILVNESPSDAIIWATAIADPGPRLDTQLDVVRQWNPTAPDAGRTWVAANLPAHAQSQALEPPGN